MPPTFIRHDLETIDFNSFIRVSHPPLLSGRYRQLGLGARHIRSLDYWLANLRQAYGVFLAYFLSHNTFPNATPMEYAFVGGLSISQALLISPLTTISTQHWGTRTTLFIGVVLGTVALISASFTTRIWHLLLSQGICFGWRMGFLFVGSMGIIPQWFSTRRSLAMGISAAGAGLWGLIYNLVAATAIQTIGLAWTYRILAAVGFVVNLFCSLLVKDRNKAVQPYQLAFDYKLFARLEFLADARLGLLERIGIHHITLFVAQLCYFDWTYSSARLGRRRPPQPGTLCWTARHRLLQRCLGKDQHGNNNDGFLWDHMPCHLDLRKELWRPAPLFSAGRNCLRHLLVDCCTRRCGSGQLKGAQ
jgi:Major Facilitator Superfamily